MSFKTLRILLLCLALMAWDRMADAQVPDLSGGVTRELMDSVGFRPDTIIAADTTTATRAPRQAIDSPVNYSATDSIAYDLEAQKVFLFGQANVEYKTINVTADYIEFDMGNEVAYARGRVDSMGNVSGKPEFRDGEKTMQSDSLHYSFRKDEGFIWGLFTQEEGGYLHSAITKRQPNDHIHIKNGMYTTCDLPHPHFYIALTKAISIPDDKIISGPAYIVLADVPLPIGIPFGFFPSTQTNQSGFILPTYGEEERRGFYLRGGGFYFALSQYLDLQVTGDVYTNGTWGVRTRSQYRKRYKFTGDIGFNYFENVIGEKGLENYSKSKDFSIRWSHAQDSRANPYQNLRASVDFSTSQYDRNHTQNINSVLRSTKRSSVSFSRLFPNAPFNFSTSLSASQNSQTRMVDLILPSASLNMNRIYPLKRRSGTGRTRFYEKLQIGYSSNLENKLRTHEDSLFTSVKPSDFLFGYRHNVPVSLPVNFLGHFTLSPNIQYTGVVFTKSIHPRYYDAFSNPSGSGQDTVMVDTIPGLRYAHAYVPSIGMSFTPKIFGMYQFRENSPIIAIRHVISPSASLNFVPDMKGRVPNYYQEVQIDTAGHTRTYPLFDESVYRSPVPSGRQGSLNLNLKNNLEMKLRSRKDTVEEEKKVKILDNLNFSTQYNIFQDSMKWSPVRMSGNTSLFNRKVSIRFNGTFSPYAYILNDNGRGTNINTALVKTDGRLFRLTNFDFSTGMSFRSGQGAASAAQEEETLANDPTANVVNPTGYNEIYATSYVDFDISWTLRVDYNFRYNKPYDEHTIIQSLRVSGDFSLTPKWRIGFNSGYDFRAKKVSTTNMSVYRDLHCWEMQVSMVPFGRYRSYSFTINIKSAVLRDLRYEKRDNWYDNF